MATDLERAFKALSGKLATYSELMSYYDGDQPLVYSTERLKEAFGNLNAKFSQNWCAVVVDATQDRLSMSGWNIEDKTADARLDDLYSRLKLEIESQDAHEAALVTGEAFVIAWKDADKIEVYYNDPRLCHVFYRADKPKVKQFAAKWWNGNDGYHYMTLYYPDRLEYYAAKSETTPSVYTSFQPMEPPTAPNPFGVIPVFHFKYKSELRNIVTLQDAVNKLFADMMVAAEYGAFAQRYVISNSDTSALKNAPNEIWNIPAGDGQGQQSSVGQFQPTALGNYLDAMDKLSGSVAIISRTPKHYFYSTGSNLSGEALLAMEVPLTKKASKYQARFGSTWQELGAFLLQLDSGAIVEPADITVVWEPVESIQPYTAAQTLQTNVGAGVPLVTALRWQGKTQAEIDVMEADKAKEKKDNMAMAQLMLDQARVQQEQDNNPLGGNNQQQDEEE